MRTSFIGAVLLVPAVLSAQVGAKGKATSQAATSVEAPNPQASAQARLHANANAAFNAPERFSDKGRAKLEGMYTEARARGLSEAAIANRVSEGEAKGASESQILVAASRVKTDMEVTQEAMLAAGRAKPSEDECARGAMLMARGVSSAQIETMARRTPSDRSLVVAFDVISQLAAQGIPVTQALARVQAKLDSRASDAALLKLAGGAGVGAGAAMGGGAGAAAGTGATAQGAANAAAKGTGMAGTVTGTVTGVVKKP
ncbi:MAG: hypothetical protein WC700_04845 [Gemmatimonadaceae bacterium]|jgi:hypothetical protein